MPSLLQSNDNLLWLNNLYDAKDPTNTDGSRKTIDNATVTWEIRTAKSPGGTLVASGNGAFFRPGTYYIELSNAISVLADTDYWYHVVAISQSGYRGQWDGTFKAMARSGATAVT